MVARGARQTLVGRLPLIEQIEAERCRRSLRTYVERAWSVVEPRRPFVPSWHIDAICEHLEAVTRGEIDALAINIPPRHMKSLTVGVFWPTWAWTHSPAVRWLFGSYKEDLATRDCLKARRLIQSPWYMQRFGDRVQLTSDQNQKRRYDNEETGYRIAMGVGGGTGEGADVGVADDPHNIQHPESDAEREAVITWWDEVMSTRLAAKVIVMQRLHEADLTGHVLARGGYEHLCLPAEYEGKPCVTVLGPQDPRTELNELLWPQRFGRKWIDRNKVELGPFGTAGQFQQRPTARSGGQFERGWFTIVDDVPRQALRVRYWDKAGTPGSGKRSAGVRMAGWAGRYWVEDIVKGQWGAGLREETIKQTAELDAAKYGFAVVIWLEQEPGSGGKESAEATIKNLQGYAVFADRPTGDKFVRASPFSASARAGNVMLLRGPWNEDFLRELEAAGPGAKFLDQMDAAAGAFNKLALGEWPAATGDEDEVYDGESLGGFVA